MDELLTHLQGKGEEACREFYRALHLHVEEVYYSLPTRLRLRGESQELSHVIYFTVGLLVLYSDLILHLLVNIVTYFFSFFFPFFFADLIDPLRYQPLYRQKYVLNERGETSMDYKK